MNDKWKTFDYQKEVSQPTVVLNIPEFFREQKKKKLTRIVFVFTSIMLFLLLGALIVFEFFFGGGLLTEESVTLTVNVEPANVAGLEVSLDDQTMSGKPPYIIIPKSIEYRSLHVVAPGYHEVLRDIQIVESKVVRVELKERIEEVYPEEDIVVHDATAPSVDKQNEQHEGTEKNSKKLPSVASPEHATTEASMEHLPKASKETKTDAIVAPSGESLIEDPAAKQGSITNHTKKRRKNNADTPRKTPAKVEPPPERVYGPVGL